MCSPKLCSSKGSDIIVYNALPGDPIDDKPEYFPTAGKTLREIHKVAFDSAGPLDLDSLQPLARSWDCFFREIWNYDIQNLSSQSSRLDFKSIVNWLSNRRITESNFLLHVDYSPKNVLVDKCGMMSVIDFEFCCSGNPLYDLAWSLMCFGSDTPGAGETSYDFLRGYIGEKTLSSFENSELQTYFMAHMLRALRVDVPNAVDPEIAKSRLEMRVNNGLESGIVFDI